MRTISTCAVAASFVLVMVAACQPKQDVTSQPGYGYPPGQAPAGYPPPGQAPASTYGYGTPPPPAPTTAPPPTAAPTGSGQMAVPGPIAFQCHDDVPCGTHHCNLQYGKCAFPCQSAADCLSPNTCIAGLCVPAPGGGH